jgi:hypothetical protein
MPIEEIEEIRIMVLNLKEWIQEHQWPKRLPNRTFTFIENIDKYLLRLDNKLYHLRDLIKKQYRNG